MADMREKIPVWWQALSGRERGILLVWGITVAILFLWFAVVVPLQNRIHQLEIRVPELEARLNAMRAQPSSAQRVQGTSDKNNVDLRSTLFRLLSDKKISAELRAITSSRVEMRLPELSMKDALDLLDDLRQESAAHVVVFNARTESAGDTARLVVEMESAP
jgi:type II secretory pathway component PulM